MDDFPIAEVDRDVACPPAGRAEEQQIAHAKRIHAYDY
jgi:hypothetical protein